MKEDITLKEMESDFKALYQDNDYKETLLKDEIRGYKLLFNKDELPLSGFSNKDKPLREYDIPYSSQQIFLIREFHRLYNVKKNDISKMYHTDWNPRTKYIYDSAWGDFLEPNALSEPHGPKYYILLAEKLSNYLKYLEEYPVQGGKPIIQMEYAGLIFDKYKEWFSDEQKDAWIERFVYPNQISVSPIVIESKVNKHGNNKLVLIAILAAIQDTTGAGFDFDTFVLKRFGIKNYQKAKADHLDKEKYIKVFKECSDIFKK